MQPPRVPAGTCCHRGVRLPGVPCSYTGTGWQWKAWLWKVCQAEELLHMVAELQEEVGRLRSIRESANEIDWWVEFCHPRGRFLNQPVTAQKMKDPLPLSCQTEGRGSESWGGRRRSGSRFLLGIADEHPCCTPHLPRCLYKTGTRLWNWMGKQMTMWITVHTH